MWSKQRNLNEPASRSLTGELGEQLIFHTKGIAMPALPPRLALVSILLVQPAWALPPNHLDQLGTFENGVLIGGVHMMRGSKNYRKAIFEVRANLTRAPLHKADLTGADLAGVDLTEADLTRAILDGANCASSSR
jgi:hypothetical protein